MPASSGVVGRYIAAFRYLLALLGRLLPVYYRLGLLLLMVLLDQDRLNSERATVMVMEFHKISWITNQ